MSDIPDPPAIETGIYRHYKGNEYEVIGVAVHTETLDPMVVYKPLYDSNVEYFSRPYEMFVDGVVHDGKTIPRFEKIDS